MMFTNFVFMVKGQLYVYCMMAFSKAGGPCMLTFSERLLAVVLGLYFAFALYHEKLWCLAIISK